MALPDEFSIYCKNEDCGVYNIPYGFCDDCAREKLHKLGIKNDLVDIIINELYD